MEDVLMRQNRTLEGDNKLGEICRSATQGIGRPLLVERNKA
jgi:hypothetical protein